MSQWHPTEDDVYPYSVKRLEDSYQHRERPKCSRDDFADGYLAALRDYLPNSAFKAGSREPESVES
jgi:hypothetical protein